jgi:hypothetical protein
MSLKQCGYSGCPNLIPVGTSRCRHHNDLTTEGPSIGTRTVRKVVHPNPVAEPPVGILGRISRAIGRSYITKESR